MRGLLDDVDSLKMEKLPRIDGLSWKQLEGNVWGGFNLTELEGDAAMNPRGGQDLVITKAYICQRRPEPNFYLQIIRNQLLYD